MLAPRISLQTIGEPDRINPVIQGENHHGDFCDVPRFKRPYVEFNNNHSTRISGPPSVITNAALGDGRTK
jgi:hypothetical protein